MGKGNEAAYPRQKNAVPGDFIEPQLGLTKRELFAAMAMQGMLANSIPGEHHRAYAVDSVKHADALLKELEESP